MTEPTTNPTVSEASPVKRGRSRRTLVGRIEATQARLDELKEIVAAANRESAELAPALATMKEQAAKIARAEQEWRDARRKYQDTLKAVKA